MWQNLAWSAGGAVIALAMVAIVLKVRRPKNSISRELQRFFGIRDAALLQVEQRSFPHHAAPDAKIGLDELLARPGVASRVMGVPVTSTFMNEIGLGALVAPSDEGYVASAVEFQSVDVGDEASIGFPKHALWFIEQEGCRFALLWTSMMTHSGCGFSTKLVLEVGYLPAAAAVAGQWLRQLERAIQSGTTYRGKILSLEAQEGYRGDSGGITVHRLRHVARDDVILPESTVALLERNLVRFVQQRATLARLGMPTKKGLLFYGPPGTGKTHTIHFLIASLKGHTTLLITAEQIGQLAEYMTLARLLQPSVVVIEDVDLIAQHRSQSSTCEQSILNRLLNEMDGLREDAEILFLLTTNRPEALETALAARPGRIDQAVEFPLPDARGREKLISLYACGARISPDVVREAVKLTEGVSASFIKELMRRALQFNLECRAATEEPEILRNDIDQAIDELLWSGGALNRALLGAGEATAE